MITNCDTDLFAASAQRLGVAFDWGVTAEEARAYKPSLRPFDLAFETIDVPRERILHVAQSLYHDHVPAKELGLSSVWIDRRRDTTGLRGNPGSRCVARSRLSEHGRVRRRRRLTEALSKGSYARS